MKGKKNSAIFNNKIPTGTINEINPCQYDRWEEKNKENMIDNIVQLTGKSFIFQSSICVYIYAYLYNLI